VYWQALVLGIATAVAVVILGVAVLMPPVPPTPSQLYVKVVPNGSSYLLYVNDSKALREVWYSKNGGPLLKADGPIRANCGDRVEVTAVYADGSRQTAAAVVRCTTPFKAFGGGGGAGNIYLEPEVEKLFKNTLQVTGQIVDIVASGYCTQIVGSGGAFFDVYYKGVRLNVPVKYEYRIAVSNWVIDLCNSKNMIGGVCNLLENGGPLYGSGTGIGGVGVPAYSGSVTYANITPLIPPQIGTVGDYIAGKTLHFKVVEVESVCGWGANAAPCCFVYVNDTLVFSSKTVVSSELYSYTRDEDAPFDIALEYGYQSPDGKFYKATIMAYKLNTQACNTVYPLGTPVTTCDPAKRWSIFAAHSPALGGLSNNIIKIELFNGSLWETNIDLATCRAMGYKDEDWLLCALDIMGGKKQTSYVSDWAYEKMQDFGRYVFKELPNGREILFYCAYHNCTDVWVRRDVVSTIKVNETAYHVTETEVTESSPQQFTVQSLAVPGVLQILVDNPTFPDVHTVLNFRQLLVNATCFIQSGWSVAGGGSVQLVQNCIRATPEGGHVYLMISSAPRR